MTKHDVMSTSRVSDRPAAPTRPSQPPAQRDGRGCDLYSPGHQIHYRHQGHAVRSPSRVVADAVLDGTLVILVLDDGEELCWRHHDPDRLRRMLDLVPGKRFAYPSQHALRVGPYWFNCAREGDGWQDCRDAGG